MRQKALVLAFITSMIAQSVHATDLVQAYETARASDPQFAQAQANKQYQQEGENQARAVLLPQISGTGSLTKTDTSYSGVHGSASQTSRSLGIQGRQTLFNWAQFSTLRAQRDLRQASDFTLAAAQQELITRTAKAYFAALVAVESLSAAQANEDSSKQQYLYTQKRLDVGLAPITDVYESRANYDQARANVLTARSALLDACQALSQITGQPISQLRGLPPVFHAKIPNRFSHLDQLLDTATTSNPTLIAANLQTQAAESNVKAAYAGHLPTVSLNGNLGRSKAWGSGDLNQLNGPNGFGNPTTQTNSIGVTLQIPIFAGGLTQSQVRQSVAQREIQQESYEQTKRALTRDTRNLYQSLVSGVAEIEARRLSVVSAKSALEASQVGLRVGTRSLLAVVQNQNSYYEAQKAYAQARYNFLQNRLLLAQDLGQLSFADIEEINRLLTEDSSLQLAQGPLETETMPTP